MFSSIIIGILSVFVIILLVFFITKTVNAHKNDKDQNPTSIQVQSRKDITEQLENLGIPFNKSGYAKNVWDMQVFNNRIYLGHGNSSSSGPNQDAGPIPVIYFDPVQNKFINQYTVNEEQIDIYKVLDGKLYIPGHDPRESWALGNFYRLDNDQWVKVRTIPKGIHTYDMARLNNKLYVGIGTENASTVWKSRDEGLTWTDVKPASGDIYSAYAGRTHTLINFNNKVYATSIIYNSSHYLLAGIIKLSADPYNRIMVTDENGTTVHKVYIDKMLPGAPGNKPFKLVRATVAFNHMIYISGQENNDHQWLPEGLYFAPDINQAKRAIFPETGILPMDILVRENKIYVLTHKKYATNQYVNIVYETSDLSQWNEVLRFKYDTFARSFEELNGDFYFGMGCNTTPIPSSTGRILRVKSSVYETDN